MNKKFKTLLMAGLVTTLTAANVVSSSALSKNKVERIKVKGAIYLCINGVKYKIPLGCNGKPSIGEDNNSNNGGNNNENNNDNIVEKPNENNNDNTVEKPNENNNDNTVEKPNENNNDNTVEKPNDNNNDNTVEKPNENNDDNTVEKPNDNNNSSNGEFASFQKEVLRLVNVERTKRGLKALTLNTELSKVATLKSQDMINKNYFSHTSPTYGSPFDMMKKFNITYKTAGENIAMGQQTPAQVVEAWMNSEGHRANILNANYTDLGVGVAKNSKGTIYWTQMFIGK